ncbi:plasmid segregation protein ParM domain-containing protein [Yersinia enterocolitica]|uniref:ParM/StbA family protein n=1 Tax=Yersinia TaxID=629 RepID=UPI0005E798B2|nr:MULTISPECIES: ParM/StbA family protein [Yersinia]MCW6560001.1 ParM/StbA family protein [Yersinia ruckeri]MCW6576399.1 ParM/StbA family protein [Yersinia ruckeri]MCW6596036.1 ParM/StbA family protein [Yersinia ruckeri]CND60270.1 plasmid stability protein StbA family protein [Yersinia pseudotuberculosis]CQH78829.1 plasmid stability protein StbA family protein [Yersinia enterocolitica]
MKAASESIKNKKSFVGVDDGYFSIKIVTEAGDMFSIPSRASYDVSIINIEGNDKSFIFETHNNKKFTVDESVPSPLDTRNIAIPYPVSDLNRVLVHAALINAGYAGKDVHINTGLPVSHYYKPSTEINQDLVEQKKANLMHPVRCGIDGSLPVANIIANEVCSEGVAAYVDQLLDADGNTTEQYEEMYNSVVGVVDIGGHTTDCAVLLPKMVINMTRSGSSEVGVLNLYDGIKTAVAAKFGINSNSITKRQIESALNTGSIMISRQAIDVSDIVTAEKSRLFDQIIMAINEVIGTDEDIEKLIFVGGGSIVFEDYLRDHYKNIIIPEHPEFANARGMMKLVKYIPKSN